MNQIAADGLPPLREVIARHGLSARKALGQNFLLDMNLTARIARVGGALEGVTVVEIGPGPGGLTRALLHEGTAPVTAVEPDRRAIAALAYLQDKYQDRFNLIEGDALQFDEASIGASTDRPLKIVANLPYNVATPLLFRWLDLVHKGTVPLTCMVLMFQKEVADRITATPDDKAYGRLSIVTQWLCQTEAVIDLPPSAFTPPPKVNSTVVRFTPRAKPLYEADIDKLEQVVSAAFGQRRKMLRQSLKAVSDNATALCEGAGIEPTRRAETLSIEEFCALARALH